MYGVQKVVLSTRRHDDRDKALKEAHDLAYKHVKNPSRHFVVATGDDDGYHVTHSDGKNPDSILVTYRVVPVSPH